jgi:hypothetical protein
MTERTLDLGHKSGECFAALFHRHFTEEIDGQTTLAKMSKQNTIQYNTKYNMPCRHILTARNLC